MCKNTNVIRGLCRQESIIYVIAWFLVFIAPIFNIIEVGDGETVFQWPKLWRAWCQLISFLILFLVHRFVLIPKFIFTKKIKFYIFSVICAIGVFIFVQYHVITAMMPPKHRIENKIDGKPNHGPPGPKLPLMMSSGYALLMLAFTLSIVGMFKNHDDKIRLQEAEKLRLMEEMKFLRAQINPHFFMNMLNNIHSLIDIDPNKAQSVIIELSKLIRHYLYETDNALTPLEKEISIISTYIDLMRGRYPEDIVEINHSFPSHVSPNLMLPSLILMPLIENAFKHGVSYKNRTVIDIAITESAGEIRFSCCNTKPSRSPSQPVGGIGLANVRRRLILIYGSDDNLEIIDEKNRYSVFLTIPENENKVYCN